MELNYFVMKLTERIASEFPDRIDDYDFIQARSELATITYEEGTRQGLTHTEALKMANDTLFQGLNYSPFQLVRRIVDEEFPEDDETELNAFSLLMLNLCTPLFKEYPINDTSFPGSKAEMELYNSITGEIQLYLEKNGMCL